MPDLTQAQLVKWFAYNPETGVLTKKRRPCNDFNSNCHATRWNRAVGKPCGTTSNGYLVTQLNRQKYRIHRLIWLREFGVWPTQIDHIYGIKDDNRLSELRDATRKENMQNKALRCDNTSGTTGVYCNKRDNNWGAKICINGKSISLGYFANKEDAIEARLKANTEFGFHENHGRKAT